MQPFDWMLRGDGRVWKPILVSSTTILIIGVVMGILHATSMNPSSLFLHLLFECLTCFFCIFGFQCLCLTFSIFCVGYGRLIAQSLVFCSTIIGFVIGAIILKFGLLYANASSVENNLCPQAAEKISSSSSFQSSSSPISTRIDANAWYLFYWQSSFILSKFCIPDGKYFVSDCSETFKYSFLNTYYSTSMSDLEEAISFYTALEENLDSGAPCSEGNYKIFASPDNWDMREDSLIRKVKGVELLSIQVNKVGAIPIGIILLIVSTSAVVSVGWVIWRDLKNLFLFRSLFQKNEASSFPLELSESSMYGSELSKKNQSLYELYGRDPRTEMLPHSHKDTSPPLANSPNAEIIKFGGKSFAKSYTNKKKIKAAPRIQQATDRRVHSKRAPIRNMSPPVPSTTDKTNLNFILRDMPQHEEPLTSRNFMAASSIDKTFSSSSSSCSEEKNSKVIPVHLIAARPPLVEAAGNNFPPQLSNLSSSSTDLFDCVDAVPFSPSHMIVFAVAQELRNIREQEDTEGLSCANSLSLNCKEYSPQSVQAHPDVKEEKHVGTNLKFETENMMIASNIILVNSPAADQQQREKRKKNIYHDHLNYEHKFCADNNASCNNEVQNRFFVEQIQENVPLTSSKLPPLYKIPVSQHLVVDKSKEKIANNTNKLCNEEGKYINGRHRSDQQQQRKKENKMKEESKDKRHYQRHEQFTERERKQVVSHHRQLQEYQKNVHTISHQEKQERTRRSDEPLHRSHSRNLHDRQIMKDKNSYEKQLQRHTDTSQENEHTKRRRASLPPKWSNNTELNSQKGKKLKDETFKQPRRASVGGGVLHRDSSTDRQPARGF